MLHVRLALLIVAALVLALAPAAAAQSPSITITAVNPETSRFGGHLTVFAGNAAIGALTGGVLQMLRGGSFKDGLVRGALGGAVIYAGKRTAAQCFWGAGLLGREINAVGISMVRNASDGEPTFGRLFLPVGPLPVRATLALRDGIGIQPQVDLAALWWLAGGLTAQHFTLDLGQTLSSGAPVFEAHDRWLVPSDHAVRGVAVARSVFLGDPGFYADPGVSPADILAHERIHVLQQDFLLTAWGDPFAGIVLGRFRAGRWIQRHAALDALGWVVGAVSHVTYGASRQERFPTELEAWFLAGR